MRQRVVVTAQKDVITVPVCNIALLALRTTTLLVITAVESVNFTIKMQIIPKPAKIVQLDAITAAAQLTA